MTITPGQIIDALHQTARDDDHELWARRLEEADQ